MQSMNRLIIKAGTVAVVLIALACTGALAAAKTSRTQPASAPMTAPKASKPQSPGIQNSAPGVLPQGTPVAEPAAQPLQADSRQMAAPTIQFSISVGTVNFGGGSLTPQATPYTQPFTTAVNSNTSWRISVTKDHDLQGTVETVPSSNFSFSAVGPAGNTTYQAPTGTEFGTDVLAVEGTRGGHLTSTITYSLIVSWGVEADNYSATHTYTAMSI